MGHLMKARKRNYGGLEPESKKARKNSIAGVLGNVREIPPQMEPGPNEAMPLLEIRFMDGVAVPYIGPGPIAPIPAAQPDPPEHRLTTGWGCNRGGDNTVNPIQAIAQEATALQQQYIHTYNTHWVTTNINPPTYTVDTDIDPAT